MLHPRARAIAALLAVAAIFAVRSPVVLAAVCAGIVVLACLTGIGKRYGWFVLTIILPLTIALVVVWGLVVAAPPGTRLGSDPRAGFAYGLAVALRLAALGGVFQLAVLTISSEQLGPTLRKCGLKSDLLVIVLGSFALLPELTLRAEAVMTARQARGLVVSRSLGSRIRQFPYLLRPLVAWALRSSVQRSEFWEQRRLLSMIDMLSGLPATQLTPRDGSETGQSVSEILARSLGTRPGEPSALLGPNFSGRTQLLRRFTGLPESDGTRAIVSLPGARPMAYVGPEIYNALSGIAQTVRAELRLHAGGAFEGTPFEEAARRLGLDRLYLRSPFDVSGGEQTCLAILSALAPAPQYLGIDCALEQLDAHLRSVVLDLLRSATQTATVIAHNRQSELGMLRTFRVEEIAAAAGRSATHGFGFINPDAIATTRQERLPIRMDGVRFGYSRDTEVIRGASVELVSGQLYFLRGSNGSGKSTLAKILTGVLKPSAGTMQLDGQPFRPWKRPGRTVAYHSQNPDLQLFATSVEEELYAAPRAARYPESECNRLAEAMMTTFGLGDLRSQHPLDLPFVMRKRVALAATLTAATPWVVLDEPTLGQDEISSIAIARVVRQLLDAGSGVIAISHSDWFRNLLEAEDLLLENGGLTIQPVRTENDCDPTDRAIA